MRTFVANKSFSSSDTHLKSTAENCLGIGSFGLMIDSLTIDSIAPRRGMHTDSGVTERIVNQLLTSIDGLESMEGVVVIAATNRPDMIDPALLRAGRFDRLIYIPPPTKEARRKILDVHTRNMPLEEDVDLDKIAEMSEGYVGADIENLCREAGMMAIRDNSEKVYMKHFLEAMKKIHPSVDEETIKYYESIGRELSKGIQRRKKAEVPVYYG